MENYREDAKLRAETKKNLVGFMLLLNGVLFATALMALGILLAMILFQTTCKISF